MDDLAGDERGLAIGELDATTQLRVALRQNPLLFVPVTSQQQDLLAALTEFVSEGGDHGDDLAGMADREAAQAMASGPSAAVVRSAADVAARANGYLVERDRQRAGRLFDDRMLHRLGIAGLLRSGQPVDQEVLVRQIAGYLSGPAESIWRHFVLNIDWNLPNSMTVAGWRLHQPTEADWKAMRPVPAAADYSAEEIWDPMLYFGRHVVLSAPDQQAKPIDGHPLRIFPEERTLDDAWPPLLLLNLWDNDSVTPVAEYLVETQRAVDRIYASIPETYLGEDGEYAIPQLGPVQVDDAHSPHMAGFLLELSIRLETWMSNSSKRALKRLRNSAMRFLATGDDVYAAWFSAARRPQLLLNYVSALENLLSGGEDRHLDLSRRTAQRTAILVGKDDENRRQIFADTRAAYNIRSTIAHGADPDETGMINAVETLRPILRRALIFTIALGPQNDVGSLCDDALLSHATLHDQIHAPIEELRRAVKAASGNPS